MACKSPIWVWNKRYYSTPDRVVPVDYMQSQIALQPWDVARRRLLVPCGHCEDCLRQIRNDWFIRINRELAYCRAHRLDAMFITITIAPKYYNDALLNPSGFIRKWFERLRHVTGRSIKHVLFQEFGEHPEAGLDPRLHFHGFLFDTRLSYNAIRKAVSDLGWIWLGAASQKRARYVVKYVVKQILYSGNNEKLRILLRDRRYTRKYVSAHVGDYLGNFAAPSYRNSLWSFVDRKTGRLYEYRIPAYYNRYLDEKQKILRQISSALTYCRVIRDDLVVRLVHQFADIFPELSSTARTDSYWRNSLIVKHLHTGRSFLPLPDLPAFITESVVDSIDDMFNHLLNFYHGKTTLHFSCG